MKRLLLEILRPLYFFLKKRYPSAFEKWIGQAGSLDGSAMLLEFNLLHRLFFRKLLSRIRISPEDIQKIKTATASGEPIIYMMRNWGQIEYNFFNLLLIRQGLPLAHHANLIRMYAWIPFPLLWRKIIARLDRYYIQEISGAEKPSPVQSALQAGKPLFLFLNLPSIFDEKEELPHDPIPSLLKTVQALQNQPVQLIPLTFVYDRKPGKEAKTMVDVLFGEKENPGFLRKTVLFFRHAYKRALTQVGDPLSLKEFLAPYEALSVPEQSVFLRKKLHQIFFKEQQAITGPKLKSRKKMIELIMSAPELQSSLKEIASSTRRPLDRIYLESEKILEEMVSDPNYTIIDLWSVVLNAFFKYVYEELVIDEATLNRIKQWARQAPLVLVPSHRSHVDYFLISYIFYKQNISMPLVASGTNLSFWPVGYLFRKAGAYFIRRSFGNDKLYPLLFKSYITTLTQEGYFQEFFIEGTRSRTGKLENPRTGLLSLFLDSHLEGKIEELYFLPISLDYEKVLEATSYAEEVRGATKKKERLWDLLHLGKYLKHSSGRVYLSVAEPISLKNYVSQNNIRLEDSEETKRQQIKMLACKIARDIEEVSVVTGSALVAAGLLSTPKKGLTISELMKNIEILRQILVFKKAPFSEPLQNNFSELIRQSLNRYKFHRLIYEHHDGVETFYTFEESRRIQLDYYKNSLLHHLASLCLLASLPEDRPESYQALAQLFRHEFIQPLNHEEAQTELAQILSQPGSPKKLTLQICSELFKNFFESYELVALYLQRILFEKMDEKTLIRKILQFGHPLYLKGDITRLESLSRFTIKNALRAYRDKGLIKTHEKELGKSGLTLYSNACLKEEIAGVIRLLHLAKDKA